MCIIVKMLNGSVRDVSGTMFMFYSTVAPNNA